MKTLFHPWRDALSHPPGFGSLLQMLAAIQSLGQIQRRGVIMRQGFMETVGNHLFNTLMQSCIVIVGDKLTNDTPHLALMPNPGRVIADVDPEEVLPAFVEQSIHRWES